MKSAGFLAVFVLALAVFAPRAQADWIDWIFPPAMPDFDHPYLENGKAPQFSQWENDDWTPEDWTSARGSKEAVINGLIDANILRDDDVAGNLPELEVGLPFLRLADKEKIHVVKYIDDAYGVTKSHDAIVIEYDNGRWLNSDITVGVYTKNGLQLQ